MLRSLKLCGMFLVLMLNFSEAFGWEFDHFYYSRNRPMYGGNIYFSQQIQYLRTDVTQTGSEDPSLTGGANYRGYVLSTGVGVEHFRFLQTGLFYNNVQSTEDKSRHKEFKGHEVGAEMRFVLSSPVTNVIVGGAAYAALKTVTTGVDIIDMSGQGWRGTLELNYFLSATTHVLVSYNHQMERVVDKSGGAALSSIEGLSQRFGMGVAIWL